jgi:hypothetical protein
MSTMRIPIFDTIEDVYWWVLCTEKYFKLWSTPQTLKMTVAALALKGPALTWWMAPTPPMGELGCIHFNISLAV